MKVIHIDDADSDYIDQATRERIALLKLTDKGVYVPDVGIWDGQYFVVSEGKDDNMYLAYKTETSADKPYALTMEERYRTALKWANWQGSVKDKLENKGK